MFAEKPDEIRQFLESAVHDLRAHHRAIATSAELLLEADTDTDRASLVAKIRQSGAKNDLLLHAISRYASVLTPSSYSMASCVVASAVRFALPNLETQIASTGATITMGELPEILGDRQKLTWMFECLLDNSLKFRSDDPPAVEIGARRESEGWVLLVKDNGEGIPEKYRGRLFTPFRRLHGADVAGAGLGLATARKIAEAHGGRIWIEGPDGKGVTICIFIPDVVVQ